MTRRERLVRGRKNDRGSGLDPVLVECYDEERTNGIWLCVPRCLAHKVRSPLSILAL